MIHEPPSLWQRWRKWQKERPYVHEHPIYNSWEERAFYRHAHLYPEMWHEHGTDLPCVMPGCDGFPKHRLHPQPGPSRMNP
jgi:hypothetical protein